MSSKAEDYELQTWRQDPHFNSMYIAVNNSQIIHTLHISHFIINTLCIYAAGEIKHCYQCDTEINVLYQYKYSYDNEKHQKRYRNPYIYCHLSKHFFCVECYNTKKVQVCGKINFIFSGNMIINNNYCLELIAEKDLKSCCNGCCASKFSVCNNKCINVCLECKKCQGFLCCICASKTGNWENCQNCEAGICSGCFYGIISADERNVCESCGFQVVN